MEGVGAPVAPAPEPEPEVLEAGPGDGGPRYRRAVGLTVLVAALVVVSLLVWQLWPRPVPPLTLDELEGVYAGMVRGDGTNDASVLHRNADSDRRSVSPTECSPLFETTAFDRFPADALDGVGTFWMAERVGTSLFTFRFADAAAAGRAYAQVAAALQACAGHPVRVADRRPQTVEVERTSVAAGSGVRDQLGYLYSPAPSTRFAVHVLRIENLMTWQFRYDTSEGVYSPQPAQQVMDSLAAQISSVIELRS